MTVVYFDSPMSDDERRRRLFGGDLFVYSPTPHSMALVAFAREMAESAFAPHFPPDAQHHLSGPEYVQVLADLKPTFINHPRSKELVRGMLADLGADVEQTYFDVPRLRSMTSEYLNAGLTLQFESHRDTWFSAPMSQLNFWMPVYDVEEANVMAFHPPYFSNGVRNSSRDYNYAQWVAHGRTAAAQQIDMETRKQPEAEEQIAREPDIRVITPPGGVLLFSGRNCTPRCRTPPAGPASPSTSGRSTGVTSSSGSAPRTSTPTAPAPRSVTSCARPIWSRCRPT